MHNHTKPNENLFLVYQIGNKTLASNSNQIRKILDIDDSISGDVEFHLNKSCDNIKIYNLNDDNLVENEDNCLLVMENNCQVKQMIGLIVTRVEKLVSLDPKYIIQKPHVGINSGSNVIEKYIKIDDQVVGVLDLNKLLQNDYRFNYERHII